MKRREENTWKEMRAQLNESVVYVIDDMAVE